MTIEVMMDSRSLLGSLGLEPARQGKVREVYDLGDGRLLIVTTDRISVFDVVLPDGIPGKGIVLTQMSAFWFQQTANTAPNHFIRLADGSAADELPFPLPRELIGRTMIVRKAHRIDIECVVRGYLSGSGWSDYQKTESICGIKLPLGLKESGKLANPIFTPTTKAAEGHDQPLTFPGAMTKVGKLAAHELAKHSYDLYCAGRDFALEKGIIIADTKFEFGWADVGGLEELIVIDEMLTPDSSRFWPADQYEPGRPQPSFDKQPVRDWAESIGWDKKPPGPSLPPDIVAQTAERYQEAFRLLTGREIAV